MIWGIVRVEPPISWKISSTLTSALSILGLSRRSRGPVEEVLTQVPRNGPVVRESCRSYVLIESVSISVSVAERRREHGGNKFADGG